MCVRVWASVEPGSGHVRPSSNCPKTWGLLSGLRAGSGPQAVSGKCQGAAWGPQVSKAHGCATQLVQSQGVNFSQHLQPRPPCPSDPASPYIQATGPAPPAATTASPSAPSATAAARPSPTAQAAAAAATVVVVAMAVSKPALSHCFGPRSNALAGGFASACIRLRL